MEEKVKNLIKILLLNCLLLLISNCDKNNPTGSEDNDYIYPITIGNQWEYQRTFSILSIRPDTMESVLDTIVTSKVIIRIDRKETLFDSIQAYVFHHTLTETNGPTFESESYYNNHDNGLFFYAYRGSGLVMPKPTSRGTILFRGNYFNTIQEVTNYISLALPKRINFSDSLIYEIPPLQSIKYPFDINSQWSYMNSDTFWQIDKKILLNENVEVPAGNLDCYKIQWLYDVDGNGEWDEGIIFYDYICSKGLVKRSLYINDIAIVGEYDQEPIGFFDVEDISVLTKINF
jgi:hypothetical protein